MKAVKQGILILGIVLSILSFLQLFNVIRLEINLWVPAIALLLIAISIPDKGNTKQNK